MDEMPILVERRDGYRVVTLNRPQRLNAFTEAMHCALREALSAAENDSACRARLLTGAGLGAPAGAGGLALTAEPLPAEQAEAWGLIWKVIDDGALIAAAEKLCVEFAAAPTIGLALTKRALDESWSNDLETQLELERDLQRQASLTPDYAEGVRAFMEKRKPVFSGRERESGE